MGKKNFMERSAWKTEEVQEDIY